MAFSFTKTTYQNGVTIIYAENLNDIQDAILYLLENGESGSSITVDSALSDSSTNPVQNKVVKKALDGKGTYTKPSGGIPASDLAPGVIPTVPTKTSELQNDSGFVDASGAAAAAPVQSVNGQTGAVEVNVVYIGEDEPTDPNVDVWVDPSDDSDAAYIPLPSSATAGQFLVYNGSAWVAQTMPSASGVSF